MPAEVVLDPVRLLSAVSPPLATLLADVSGWVKYVADGLWHRRDPRLRNRLLQASPGVVPMVLLLYILLVRYGPVLMRDRKAPPLKGIMAVYNCVQVILCGYMTIEFVLARSYNLACSTVEVTNRESAVRLADACWLFHISKMVDLLDTLFLVLKKDLKRMTYLHVFHHASMYISCWLITLFTPGGSCWFGCSLNCFVHFVMYSYYLLAGLGPRVRPYLWWKRYLTQLQLVQFALVGAQIIVTQLPGVRCGAPDWATAMTFVYVLVITGLFINFYTQAYCNAAKRSQPKLKMPKLIPDVSMKSNSLAWRMLRTHGLGCFHTND